MSVRRDAGRRQRGQVTAFVVVFATALLLMAGLVIDGGLALGARVRAGNEAQAAARAGAQAIDLALYRATGFIELNPRAAVAAAQRYLATTGDTGSVQATAQEVLVTVTVRQPTQILGIVKIGSLTVSGRGEARPEHGVVQAEP